MNIFFGVAENHNILHDRLPISADFGLAVLIEHLLALNDAILVRFRLKADKQDILTQVAFLVEKPCLMVPVLQYGGRHDNTGPLRAPALSVVRSHSQGRKALAKPDAKATNAGPLLGETPNLGILIAVRRDFPGKAVFNAQGAPLKFGRDKGIKLPIVSVRQILDVRMLLHPDIELIFK